jgi:LysR family glycine cleavage system transcriptional activator
VPNLNDVAVDRLPLSSLRVFAAVGRLLSITRAADELEVTPAAVSHHIKTLEKFVGTALVRRERNKIALTSAGKQYLVQVSDGLLLLSNATRSMKAAKDHHIIRVACPPSLAVLWLIERVGRFMVEHKDIVVAVTSAPNPPAMLDNTFDVAFWYGQGVVPGMELAPLGASNRLFPICHRQLVENEPLSITDLPRFCLLDASDDSYYDKMQPRLGWRAWLRAAGLPEGAATRFLQFTPHFLMHRAVAAKLGVGLSRTLLAVDALGTREIVMPFGRGLLQPSNYHLLYSPLIAKRKEVQMFRDWILAEAAASVKRLEMLATEQGAEVAAPAVERRRGLR